MMDRQRLVSVPLPRARAPANNVIHAHTARSDSSSSPQPLTERAEAEVVYSKLTELAEAGAILDQHVFQAEELESAVDELDATDPASTLWIERLRDVMALLADHVRDEALDFFRALSTRCLLSTDKNVDRGGRRRCR